MGLPHADPNLNAKEMYLYEINIFTRRVLRAKAKPQSAFAP